MTSRTDDPVSCPGCGAPWLANADDRCAYCNRPRPEPEVAPLPPPPPPVAFGTGQQPMVVQVGGGGRSGAGRALVLLVTMAIVGGVGYFAFLRVADVTDTIATGAGREITLPGGMTVPGAAPAAAGGGGYLTPVANPKIKAPVNDLAAAAEALKAKVGRPVHLNDLHLYEDGRIIFSVQAADDPAGTDDWTWKRGTFADPTQGIIPVRPDGFFPLEGANLANLEQICITALGKTGIADGVIDHPYLVKLSGSDVRWYIPVTSLSRKTNTKTYRVSLDGRKEDVF